MNNLLLHYLLTVIITAGSVQAQALNVTDLLSYPPCAVSSSRWPLIYMLLTSFSKIAYP